ncbi:unnamed protein product [Alternaria sp. RS040]
MEQHQDSTSGERCKLIKLDSHIPSKAASPEYTFAFAYKKPQTIPKTWECMGTQNRVGLLDLPRELRDMIYAHVCDGMRRNGNGWRKEGEWAQDRYVFGQGPWEVQNCNIMRTCRQVHWEFAEVLYTRPLQLTGPSITKFHIVVTGSHILPLSKTYAPLVKKLAFIHGTGLRDYFDRDELGHRQRPNAEVLWLVIVTATMKLLKLFPAVQVLRIIIDYEPIAPPDSVLMSLLGKCKGRREELVERAEEFIKAVRRSDTRPIKVPQQLELFHLEDNGILREMPWGEALRNIQAAELHKKELREKS